jgi:hypothetical protein
MHQHAKSEANGLTGLAQWSRKELVQPFERSIELDG